MVARIITYEAESRAAADAWIREHADELRAVEGLERVTFLRSRKPPRVGAVMVFASDDALARFQTTGPFERLRESVRQLWAAEQAPAHEGTYRVVEEERSADGGTTAPAEGPPL